MNRSKWLSMLSLCIVLLGTGVPGAHAEATNTIGGTQSKSKLARKHWLTTEMYQKLQNDAAKQQGRVEPLQIEGSQACIPTWQVGDPCGRLQSGG